MSGPRIKWFYRLWSHWLFTNKLRDIIIKSYGLMGNIFVVQMSSCIISVRGHTSHSTLNWTLCLFILSGAAKEDEWIMSVKTINCNWTSYVKTFYCHKILQAVSLDIMKTKFCYTKLWWLFGFFPNLCIFCNILYSGIVISFHLNSWLSFS